MCKHGELDPKASGIPLVSICSRRDGGIFSFGGRLVPQTPQMVGFSPLAPPFKPDQKGAPKNIWIYPSHKPKAPLNPRTKRGPEKLGHPRSRLVRKSAVGRQEMLQEQAELRDAVRESPGMLEPALAPSPQRQLGLGPWVFFRVSGGGGGQVL